MIGDWIYDHFGAVCLVAIAIFVALFVVAINAEEQERVKFMNSCLQDKKEYECKAMWRSGQANIVPMPIVIPIR